LDTLLLVIGSIGLLAFLMSAVLVSQLIASMLAQQVRQIGILKAIGGRKSQIVSIYVIMLLFFGIASSVIAVPLSISAGYAYSYFVASVLNFNVLTTSLPAYVILLLISVGVFFPLILSYKIVNDGVKVSVRDAFDDYGIKMKTQLIIKKKLKLQFLSDEIVIAVRNTFRKKGRLAIMITSMALGVAIFSTGFNVRQSLSNLVQNVDKSLQYDVQVVLSDPMTFEESEKLFGSLENLAYSEGWNGGMGLIQSNQVSTDNEIGIISLPYDTDLLKLKIIEGSWLSAPGTLDIVINQQAIEPLGLPKIGDEVKLMIKGTETSFRLKGIAENFDSSKIYMDAATYDQLANKDHLTNSIMLVSKKRDYDSVVSFKKAIERTIEGSKVSVLYVLSQSERVKIIYDHLNIILTTILFLAFLVLMVSALGMSSAMSINIIERTREIGIMRAIGATPKKIVTILVTEGMIICLISIVIGLALAQPLSALASIFFGKLLLGETAILSYAFSFIGVIITIVTTVMIGYFASRTPAKNIINQPVQSMGVY
ncbi:MAG: ABC transporter permease, partial [Mobilitalea sp.]